MESTNDNSSRKPHSSKLLLALALVSCTLIGAGVGTVATAIANKPTYAEVAKVQHPHDSFVAGTEKTYLVARSTLDSFPGGFAIRLVVGTNICYSDSDACASLRAEGTAAAIRMNGSIPESEIPTAVSMKYAKTFNTAGFARTSDAAAVLTAHDQERFGPEGDVSSDEREVFSNYLMQVCASQALIGLTAWNSADLIGTESLPCSPLEIAYSVKLLEGAYLDPANS